MRCPLLLLKVADQVACCFPGQWFGQMMVSESEIGPFTVSLSADLAVHDPRRLCRPSEVIRMAAWSIRVNVPKGGWVVKHIPTQNIDQSGRAKTHQNRHFCDLGRGFAGFRGGNPNLQPEMGKSGEK
jgi:hypothetical protein